MPKAIIRPTCLDFNLFYSKGYLKKIFGEPLNFWEIMFFSSQKNVSLQQILTSIPIE